MSKSSTIEQIATCARDFHVGELSVDDVQEFFAALDVPAGVAPDLEKRISEARLELDAIRFGMCERGQRAEIERIFIELEQLTHPSSNGI